MLVEITGIEQQNGEPPRRWFSNTKLDLFVWYDESGTPLQFQLCFNKGNNEQALTWHRDAGLSRHAVDDGEGGIYRMKSSPVLTAAQAPEMGSLRRDFIDAGQKLEHDLYEFVLSRIPGP